MSGIVLGGLAAAVGSALIVRRVKEIKTYYAGEGSHDVLVAVCVDSSCVVDHVDTDGSVYSDVSLSSGDLVVGGKVVVKSGRMFIMVAEKVGVV
jgi:hypothetical protein